MIIAITGATGFVGGAVLEQAVAAGHDVRAITRRPQPPRTGVTWIECGLDDDAALARACAGAGAVLHIAGAVNVPTREAFAAANIDGTRAVVAAAQGTGVRRFVHVSSLAAREPALSNYGWSKAEAERVVEGSALDWTIIRPPGVYGPGDRDMLESFKMAKRGLMLLPPGGRGSWVHVADLARLLVSAATRPDWLQHCLFEVEGGPAGGVTHLELGALIRAAVDRPTARLLAAPGWAIRLAARGDRLVRGDGARLTPDRAGYMLHPDWVSRPEAAVPEDLWQPEIPLPAGIAATARWYTDHGWL